MRPSQRACCSGVPPTTIGSLPRNVASTDVATPRSMAAIRSHDPVDVEGRAAHAAVLLGDEQQLDAEVVAAHPLDELGRELVTLVEVDEQLLGQLVRGEVSDRVERHLQHVAVQASHVSVLLRGIDDVADQRRGGHVLRVSPRRVPRDRDDWP